MNYTPENTIWRLVSIWLKSTNIQTSTQFQLLDSISRKSVDGNARHIPTIEKIRVAPMISYEEILTDIFKNKETTEKYFRWKKVSDVWWWFSWLPGIVWKVASEISIIDPLFWEDFWKLLVRDYKRIEWFLYESMTKLEENKNSDDKNLLEIRKNNVEKYTKVLNNLKYWFRWNLWTNTRLINCVWEDINEIQSLSQDIVFCKNILWKENTNNIKILLEAERILKIWWEIYIITDDDWYNTNFLDWLLNQELVIFRKLWYTIFRLIKQ